MLWARAGGRASWLSDWETLLLMDVLESWRWGSPPNLGKKYLGVERGTHAIGGITKGWGNFVTWVIAMFVDPVTGLRGRQDLYIGSP